MILVDSNVLIDVWTEDPLWGEWSAAALERSADQEPVGINPIIYAELCTGFDEESELGHVLEGSELRQLTLPIRAAWPAARAFEAYRSRGGTRSAPLPDFFIGAHALVEGFALLTRDASRYRSYFPRLRLITPE